jgi:hypothetical protein
MTVTLKKNHQQVKKMMRSDVADGQNRAIASLVQEAQSNAPVKTGNLRNKIVQTVKATPGSPRAEGRSQADYSVPVNQGTPTQAGTFFWTRAVNQMMAKYGSFFKR